MWEKVLEPFFYFLLLILNQLPLFCCKIMGNTKKIMQHSPSDLLLSKHLFDFIMHKLVQLLVLIKRFFHLLIALGTFALGRSRSLFSLFVHFFGVCFFRCLILLYF